MKINPLINRSKFFILNPKIEWGKIKNEELSPKEIFILYFVPLFIFGCILKISGRFLLQDFSIYNAILYCISFISISTSIIYISSKLINEILPKFKIEKNFNLIFKLIAYSSIPAILANSISSLHPDLNFINLFSVYSFVLFWIGSTKLFEIPKDYKIIFAILSIVLISIITLILSYIFTSIVVSLALLKL